MHELAISQAIFDTALRHAQVDAKTIRALHVRVGVLSGIVPDSIQFCFDLIGKGTLAEGVRLNIEIIPPRARCCACGAERDLPLDTETASEWPARMSALEPCSCGQQVYELTGGLGCYLDSMDVE